MGETKEARAARLKTALRDNLKRRKAQTRARAEEPGDREPGDRTSGEATPPENDGAPPTGARL